MGRVIINGREVDLPNGTPEAVIRREGGVRPQRKLLERRPNGTVTLIPPGAWVDAPDGAEYLDIPPIVKGGILRDLVNLLVGEEPPRRRPAPVPRPARAALPPIREPRYERVRREVALIAPDFVQHGGVWWDERNADWVLIKHYPLPDRWQERFAQLLLVLPATYPFTPPIGFYLSKDSALRDGRNDPHFVGFGAHGAADLRDIHWYWYCVGVGEGAAGWRPAADFRRPDNLKSFLAIAHQALATA